MKQKTKKRHTSPYTPDPLFTAVTKSLPATLGFAVLAIVMGILFILLQGNTTPVPREEAIAYEGEFARYEVERNDRDLCFTDGSNFDVYAHTETNAFQETMKSLEEGTKLWILVHPHSDYVIEIKTETEELMNFEESQVAIDRYVIGYKVIGGIMIFAGLFVGFYGIWSQIAHRKEQDRKEARHQKQKKTAESGLPDMGLRRADMEVKHRVLLEATYGGLRICYRRVRKVNELVVGGVVYDEMKAVVEFPHDLTVTLDGHRIHAGLDEDDFSYIIVDGRRIAEKKRWI